MITEQNKKPLISIIIPTYNRGHIINETLDSILGQAYAYWECIIIDDGSTDHTEEVIKNYCVKDNRFTYYKRPEAWKRGSSGCRNYGYSLSQGEFINWFDSDDIMHPHKLNTDLKAMHSGAYDFTISQSDFFGDDQQPSRSLWNTNLWSDDPINDFILLKIGWGLNSPLWKKDSLEKLQLKFDENIITATDYLYHIEALTKKMKPIVIDQVLVSQRQHSRQMANHYLKAPSKLYVNSFLYINKDKFNLNSETLRFLKQQFKIQFSALLKMKRLDIAFRYLVKFSMFGFNMKTKIWYFKKFIFGLWYKISNKGYDYIDY